MTSKKYGEKSRSISLHCENIFIINLFAIYLYEGKHFKVMFSYSYKYYIKIIYAKLLFLFQSMLDRRKMTRKFSVVYSPMRLFSLLPKFAMFNKLLLSFQRYTAIS